MALGRTERGKYFFSSTITTKEINNANEKSLLKPNCKPGKIWAKLDFSSFIYFTTSVLENLLHGTLFYIKFN